MDGRVAVVTNRFHQFRAERVFRKAAKALGLEVVTARMPLKLEMTTQFPPPGWGALARVRESCGVGSSTCCERLPPSRSTRFKGGSESREGAHA